MVCDHCQGRESSEPVQSVYACVEVLLFFRSRVYPITCAGCRTSAYVRLACVVRRVFDDGAIVEHDAT